MVATRSLALTLSVLLAVAAASPLPRVRARRQLADDNTLQPIEDAEGDEQTREKRKLEGVTQAKFGIKNAVLGFVFGDGITSRRQARSTDQSTQGSSSMITKSSSHTTASVTNLSSSITNPSSIPNQLSSNPSTSSTKEVTGRGPRQADDIPVFDRNKVSLDFPGNLFGPSLSLLIRTTKVVGDVIQNSAVRYQSFLRLFRPLFRGPFEIKGLDPATTTTTTTTTTAKPTPAIADNEITR